MLDRKAFYQEHAERRLRKPNRFYRHLLRKYYSHFVPPGLRVLEAGCGDGDLLAAVKPSRGVGIDFSHRQIACARERHPEFVFHEADILECLMQEFFDYIILSDVINDLPDVQAVFSRLCSLSHKRTRLILNFFNNLWRPCLHAGNKLGLNAPTLPQNWLSTDDVKNLLHLSGWEFIRIEPKIIWPLGTPFISNFLNKFVAPFLPHFCLTIFVVARPKPQQEPGAHYTCSVIIPARNEAGNIEKAVQSVPELGRGTELIFIEGHSTDNTWSEIERVAKKYRHRQIKHFQQQTQGKGAAVREGFAAASGDLLLILDADLTVPPDQLQTFYDVARLGTGEFINGVRLVYPMEQEAMQFLNMVANKLFGIAFSWLLGQKIKDTLCGTKVLFRADYEAIARNRACFGNFDPFGDFDLLFGAAKLNLRLIDLPIRYRARTYGQTNIRRWQHGWLLFRMVLFAGRHLKFL